MNNLYDVYFDDEFYAQVVAKDDFEFLEYLRVLLPPDSPNWETVKVIKS